MNEKSAITSKTDNKETNDRQSAINNQRLTSSNKQSTISNQESTISDKQSSIKRLCIHPINCVSCSIFEKTSSVATPTLLCELNSKENKS